MTGQREQERLRCSTLMGRYFCGFLVLHQLVATRAQRRKISCWAAIAQMVSFHVCMFVVKADHLDDLVRLGTVTRQAAKFLEACVVAGLNILVAGGTQAGKPANS